MTKKIIIGEIYEGLIPMTPIRAFRIARKITKKKEWTIKTNNPQIIEAIEVLHLDCIDEIEIYLLLNNKCKQINFQTAYEYLGDLYDLIDVIRLNYGIFERRITDEEIDNELMKYKEKYNKVMEE